jgi:hypothetical protein
MIKFVFKYGNMDDFNEGPKCLCLGVKNSNIAKYLVLNRYGVEYCVSRRYMPFYELPWSFSWRKKKK